MGNRLDELAAATPGTRDRYVDLLRAISIVAVVFHRRIFGLFGAGDTAALRTLRD